MRRASGEASTSSDSDGRATNAPRPVSLRRQHDERLRHIEHASGRPAPRRRGARARPWTPLSPSAAKGMRLRRCRRIDQRDDRLHEIADVEQIAPVRDRAERQRRAARDRIEQRQEVALDARPVDERQPQHDGAERCSAPRSPRAFARLPACCARTRRADQRVVGAKRPAGHRRFAVHLDRAREHEPPHARAHRGGRHALERDDIRGVIQRRGSAPSRAAHARDRRDARSRPRRRRSRRARCRTPSRDRRPRACACRGAPSPAACGRPRRTGGPSRAMRDERTADEAVGTGDDDRPGVSVMPMLQTNRQPCLL